MDTNLDQLRRPTAVAMRLTWDLGTGDPECRRWGRSGHASQGRFAVDGTHNMVHILPRGGLATPNRQHDVAQPTPAFLHASLGGEDGEEALRPPFAAHQSSVRFRKRAGGQHQFGLGCCFRMEMVESDDVLEAFQQGSDLVRPFPAVEIILQNDRRLHLLPLDCFERRIQRFASKQANAKCVAFRRGKA
jgi:hypothetical protein